MELVVRQISVFSILLFILTFGSNAQPVSSFIAPVSGCLNETISLNNTSSSATRYVWDFCHTDLQTANPFTTNVTTLPTTGSFFYNSIKLVNDHGSNIAFITDMNGIKLYRLNFGSDWSSMNPTVDDLGNLGGLLNSPGAIDVVFDNGVWYLFILNLFGNSAIRVTMGNGLLSEPTLSENLGNIGSSFSTPIAVKIILNGNSRLLFVSNLSNQSISVISFLSSFSAVPSFVHGLTNNAMVDPSGLDLISDGISWFGVASSFDNSGHSVLLNFGNDLLSTPSFSDLGIIPAGRQVKLAQEGLTFTGFVRSENDGIYKINFGTDFSSPQAPTKLSANLINASRGMDLIKDTPSWKLFTVESTGANLLRLDFIGDCTSSISINSSTQTTPPNVNYTSIGNYFIELSAFDNSNEMSVSNSVISISSLISPDIDFTNQNNCINNNVNFASVSLYGNINGYAWNFGDGGSSSNSNPSYIYTSAGSYKVALVVTDVNGCKNTIQKSIQVFNPPIASFDLPTVNPICTGQNYTFTNTSTYDNGSSPNWQWSVNGVNAGSTQDLSYLFNASTSQTILLIASIPGCTSQSTQTLNSIQPGPQLAFTSPAYSCVGSPVSLTNTSVGSVLGYTWSYGDGNTSAQTDGTNSYSTAGVYDVTLSASNVAGCQNSFTKSITIYSNPVADLGIDLPPFSCAASPSQFYDLTTPPVDSNITGWSWQFGDAGNGTSSQRNPAYTYSTAGDYNVSLQVTTNFGCTSSKQKTVTISPSPTAAFTNSAACVNLTTQFTDASTGSIKSWQWKMPGVVNPINAQNTTFTFKSASTFPVTLSVTATNNCINQITKNIVVPVPPVIDFSILYPCTGNATQFQETNPGGSDPAVSWDWNFSSGTGTGNPANYTFSTAGIYTVTLSSTRQSQCVYTISKNLSIVDGPIAAFATSATGGGAPLNVSFTNNSTFADSYSWSFGDAIHSTTTDFSPSFTYTELGSYTVNLTASNTFGCTNTASTVIDVVVPNVDAALTSFALVDDPATTSKRAVVTIKNAGNISFLNPVVSVDLGGNVSLKETVSASIPVGGFLSKTLNMEIVPNQISYACAKVVVASDLFPDNNEQCVPLTQNEVILSPYPNPASSEFTIEWINPSVQDVRVIVFKTSGQIAFDDTVSAPAGLTQFKIETSTWASGLYLVQVNGFNSQKLYRVAVVN